jgi:hypothetical protein
MLLLLSAALLLGSWGTIRINIHGVMITSLCCLLLLLGTTCTSACCTGLLLLSLLLACREYKHWQQQLSECQLPQMHPSKATSCPP